MKVIELQEKQEQIQQLEKRNQDLEFQQNIVMLAQEEAEESLRSGLVSHQIVPGEPSTEDQTGIAMITASNGNI